MSYIASEWAFRQRVGSPMAKLVLARLAERADKDTGECHPSFDSIAAETELSRRTVIRQIAVLEAGGWLEVVRCRRGNQYRLACSARVAPEAPSDATSGSDTESPQSDSLTPEKCQPVTSEVSPCHPDRQGPSSNRQRTGGRARKRADRATRLPDDWLPSQADSDFALKEGLDHDAVRRAADRFRDYRHAEPGARARKLDWSKTWRNWVRKDADDARRGRAPPAGNAQTGSQGTGRRSQGEVKRDLRSAGFEAINGKAYPLASGSSRY